MKMRTLFLFLSILVSASALAARGGGHSGGGMGVIYPNGQVRFLDLTEKNDLPQPPLDQKGIIDQFYTSKRFVKALATPNLTFFSCAKERFRMFSLDFPVLKKVLPTLNSVTVLNVEFRLIPVRQSSSEEILLLPILASYSTDTPESLQEPLAAYSNGRVWVARRLYDKLSSELDKCGLAVHEALRQINFGKFLERDLTTKEIEIITRYMMGLSRDEDNYTAALNKLKNHKLDFEGYMKLHELALEKAEVLLKMAKNLKNGSDEQQKLMEERNLYLLHSHTYLNKSMGVIVNDPEIRKIVSSGGVLESTVLDSSLNQELGPFQYFDLVNLKIVNRPAP